MVGKGFSLLEQMARQRLNAIRAGRRRSTGKYAFQKYRDDPVGFANDVLKLRVWSGQCAILSAIASAKKCAICSGQKTGKSTAFVIAAIWWACTRPRGRVLLTAPTNHVVRTVLWKELHRIVYMQGQDGRLLSGPEVLGAAPALLPSTGMHWPDGREIIGGASDTPEATQGFSGPEILVIIDEAAGVKDPIFEAIDGNCAAGGHIAAASNPTQQSGFFFDAFHLKREHWNGIHISSEETPNVTGAEEPIPGLADPEFIRSARAMYGEDSGFYAVRVRGEFAGTATNAIVGLADVDAAQLRAKQRTTEPDDALEFGVDVARFGDDESTIAPRRGLKAYDIIAEHGLDTIALTGTIMKTVRAMRRHGDDKPRIKIDSSGGYGGGVADLLRSEHADEVEVIEVNASERADDPDQYTNRRAQLHFGVADWLKDGGELPDDKKLEAELLAATYAFDVRGRRKVESKDDIKKRLKRSPDRADALALAIFHGHVPDDGGAGFGGTWR